MRPRSTMRLLPFSKRRTTPLMSSPLRSLNSLKMRSRSSSRTRWMSTCFAVCAAMRPKAWRGLLDAAGGRRTPCPARAAFFASLGCQKIWKPSSSPSSASSPGFCASSSAISRSSSATSSTTVMYWKRSTWPVSSLKRASSSRFGPNTLCAALRIASSTVFTRRVLSIPLSFATISRMLPRLVVRSVTAAVVAMTPLSPFRFRCCRTCCVSGLRFLVPSPFLAPPFLGWGASSKTRLASATSAKGTSIRFLSTTMATRPGAAAEGPAEDALPVGRGAARA